jgi:hypothetical protein
MRRFLSAGAALALFAVSAVAALGDTAPPTTTPFPAASTGPVFVAAQTATTTGAMSSWFAPGSTIVFRAYAVDTKLTKVLVAKDVKYFYATIPNEPNLKFKYNPKAAGATAGMPWTAQWTVPASYPTGIVNFKVLVKTQAKRVGQFVQMPVATSMLNISPTAPPVPAPGPTTTSTAAGDATSQLALYVDSVNGTAPAGGPVRPIGCTQTNVYHRGERIVVRSWGFDLKTGDTLTNDNVDTATFTIPGQAPVTLAWGAHGATGAKVWFWTNFFLVPASFPLGDVTIHVAFKTVDGHAGSFDYPITIIP